MRTEGSLICTEVYFEAVISLITLALGQYCSVLYSAPTDYGGLCLHFRDLQWVLAAHQPVKTS